MSYHPVTLAGTRAVPAHTPIRPDHGGLRICLLGYRSHPHVGGQGIYLHYLSKALVELGHQVDVISGPPYPELDPRVKLIRLPSLDLYAVEKPLRALRWRHLRSFTDVYEWWSKISGSFAEPYTFGRRLVRYFREYSPQYDIIHDNQSLCYGLLTLQKQGLPVVATVHHPITRDLELAVASAKGWGHRWLIRRWYNFLLMQKKVVQQLHHVITVSEQSRHDIVAAFARPAHQIQVIPNGIDVDIFRPRPDIQRNPWQLMTTASSDQPLKGLSVLLRALARLRKSHPQVSLLVIGKLKPDGATERELQQLDLSGCVQFISGISVEEIVAHYAASSVAVVPSLYEGFGLPAGEAMACGIPLVCSDGGALPEVVGDAAHLVKAGDVDDLVQALEFLLHHPAQRELLGQRGRAHILQQLSWSVVAQQMTTYYRQMLGESPADARITQVPTHSTATIAPSATTTGTGTGTTTPVPDVYAND